MTTITVKEDLGIVNVEERMNPCLFLLDDGEKSIWDAQRKTFRIEVYTILIGQVVTIVGNSDV